ncbi:hypothetical protein [Nitrosomonas oligotropha]|uniref:hypothetical protein n=1 Tax=Nitrosomonas oligotropha TaxID=42354 RepID=UPI00136A68B0|nr:hypothetical protein [Nitrosomonas oligotropha]MXS84330.1 hypothetical protein [Nitrosomonas oligotropha]
MYIHSTLKINHMNNVLPFAKRSRHNDLIELKRNNPSLQIQWDLNGTWIDIDNPPWHEDVNYRVKPEQILRYRKYLDIEGNEILVGIDASKRSDFVKWLGDWQEMKV